MINNNSIHFVQIGLGFFLTCGDVSVCDIHSVTQGDRKAVVAQDPPYVVQCSGICNIQLHIYYVFNLS